MHHSGLTHHPSAGKRDTRHRFHWRKRNLHRLCRTILQGCRSRGKAMLDAILIPDWRLKRL